MSELLNEQYNSIFSTPGPTMTIKYPKDFFGFGHPQGNTLSDINITREDIIDAIKTMSQNSSGGPDEFPAIIIPILYTRVAPGTFPRTTVLYPLHNT